MKRLWAAVTRKGDLSIVVAGETQERMRFESEMWRNQVDGWTPLSEPVEYIAADEVTRLIAEAVAAARRAA